MYTLYIRTSRKGPGQQVEMKEVSRHLKEFTRAFFPTPPSEDFPIPLSDGTWQIEVPDRLYLPAIIQILTQHYGFTTVGDIEPFCSHTSQVKEFVTRIGTLTLSLVTFNGTRVVTAQEVVESVEGGKLAWQLIDGCDECISAIMATVENMLAFQEESDEEEEIT